SLRADVARRASHRNRICPGVLLPSVRLLVPCRKCAGRERNGNVAAFTWFQDDFLKALQLQRWLICRWGIRYVQLHNFGSRSAARIRNAHVRDSTITLCLQPEIAVAKGRVRKAESEREERRLIVLVVPPVADKNAFIEIHGMTIAGILQKTRGGALR